MSPTLDIIVPVYRGEAETRACLSSVLGATAARRAEIVVVDDASPEPLLSAWLRELGDAGRITLLAHPENRGFVASVNEGMALHPDRDVILLNSDTEVASGWIDRLTRHAERDPAVGTVTPFSGNATICSYPRTLQANGLPESETTDSLDAAFAAANPARSVEIPTAVGFCMHVTRHCLDRVGPFDQARYGRGYGEEVDFCMRAVRAGFRNVLAGDVYVRHIGEVSFGDVGADRRLQAQATVDALYPEFQERLREFLASDPARALRRRADLERLRASRKPRELFVVLSPGGKAHDAASALAAGAARDCEPLLLEAPGDGASVLRWLRPGEEFALFVPRGTTPRALARILRQIGIARVNLPDSDPVPRALLALPRTLSCASLRLRERAGAGPVPAPPAATGSRRPWPEIPEEWLDAARNTTASPLRRLARWLRRL